uniref:Sperm acrosome membrane-associated protein 3 n=1 Tax=Sus scrofa TaxID=9823 RepID=A0A8D0XH30_PIG
MVSAVPLRQAAWLLFLELSHGQPHPTWPLCTSLLSSWLHEEPMQGRKNAQVMGQAAPRLGLAGLLSIGMSLLHLARPGRVCLAYFASGFNTAAVDHEADGSTNSGIFQINSRKWCRNLNPSVPNLCQMYCSDLLNPNLKDTIICAMKIAQDPKGLGTWEAWRHHCQGKDLTDWVDGCDL